jgi:hypothetical protein
MTDTARIKAYDRPTTSAVALENLRNHSSTVRAESKRYAPKFVDGA